MPDANELKAALERLIAGAGTDSDVSALRAAHSTGVLVTGDQVPPPPADFTGRADEQRELLAAIEQGGITISGLQGMGRRTESVALGGLGIVSDYLGETLRA